ncbi:MAG: bifunctional 4-hydroxy-2-oxoglutarate aldolase/2-dehydro-3-deoxy-phosphogluconate aldolase [Oscillospiraceae bacterium]
METIEKIKNGKLIAIMRGVPADKIINTANALLNGGVTLIEVTFNQSGDLLETSSAIRRLIEQFGDSICVGAGTVMTEEQVRLAHTAGAKYIISPDTNPQVIKLAKELGLVAMPGALTPTEISTAYRLGADIVKIFPCGNFGPEYVKAIKGPISHIPLAAVGGVGLENINEFISAGISCFGLGSNIVDKKMLAENNFAGITALAKEYVRAINGVERAGCSATNNLGKE